MAGFDEGVGATFFDLNALQVTVPSNVMAGFAEGVGATFFDLNALQVSRACILELCGQCLGPEACAALTVHCRLCW